MRPGSVIVDIAIDQGGCSESIRPTSHKVPVYNQHGVIHYAVPNMPALVGRTSTQGLTQATEPYVALIVQKGVEAALWPSHKEAWREGREHPQRPHHLRRGRQGPGLTGAFPARCPSLGRPERS